MLGILQLGGAACPRGPTLHGPALVFTHSAPYTCILSGLQSPLQAGVDDWAPAAHTLRLFYLEQGRTRISHREEQLRILIQARCATTPIHADHLLLQDEIAHCENIHEWLHSKGADLPAPTFSFLKLFTLNRRKQEVAQAELAYHVSDASQV